MATVTRAIWRLALAGALLNACATGPAKEGRHDVRSASFASPAGRDWARLAGLWDYEEGTVIVTLSLDERGNGTYLYQGARFETTSLDGLVWRGFWQQSDHDREGGFEVKLADDLSQGEGRWWYTRICTDRSPQQPGGTFHLSRSDSTPPGKTIITRPQSERHGK